jgi:predicted nucleic acid-binding protein
MLVFDASTLIILAKADLLGIFLADFGGRVSIPSEVAKECCEYKKTLDAWLIQKFVDEGRIEVLTVRNRSLVLKLQSDFSLGRGEAEAIILALNAKADLIGIDDRQGINACRMLGMPFATALNILVRAKAKGLLETDEAMAKLKLLAKYGRYRHSMIEDAERQLEAHHE